MNTPKHRTIAVILYCCGCLLTWACSRVTAPDSDDDTMPDWTEKTDTATDTATGTPTTDTPTDSTANSDDAHTTTQTPELAYQHTSWILDSFRYQGEVVAVDPTRTRQVIDTDPTSTWNYLILYYDPVLWSDPSLGDMSGMGMFQEAGVQFEGTVDYAASNVSRGLFRLSHTTVYIKTFFIFTDGTFIYPDNGGGDGLPYLNCDGGCPDDVLTYWHMLESVVTMQFDGHVLTVSNEDGSNTATYHLSEYDLWNLH